MNRLGKSFAVGRAVKVINPDALRIAMNGNEQTGVEVVGGVTDTLQAVMVLSMVTIKLLISPRVCGQSVI